jgi:hypothetical protein
VSLGKRIGSIDLAVLPSVPGVQVLVQLLPESVRGALMMNYGSPSMLTEYTTHFVHAGRSHLAGNVGVYLVAIALAYALFSVRGRAADFFTGFALVVFAAPVPLSLMDLWIVSSQVGNLPSRGFFALASAFY